ncbi:hypothetical protein NWF32_25705 [Pseudomonas qingdaonensis]|nr:hypothetical protein [Pseudomonas qingdaonensis]
MNTHGTLIEARRNRPLMSSFHAVFSIGGLAGASAVATLLSDTLGAAQCLGLAGLLMAAVTLLAARWLGDLRPRQSPLRRARVASSGPTAPCCTSPHCAFWRCSSSAR